MAPGALGCPLFSSLQFSPLSLGLLEEMGVWEPVGTCVVTETMMVIAASSSSPRYTSDLERARPQTSGEEELQLQLALAMSREEAEKVRPLPGAAQEVPQLGWAGGGHGEETEGGRRGDRMHHTPTLRLSSGPQSPSPAPKDSTGPVCVPGIVP